MKRSSEPLRLLLADAESGVHTGHPIACVTRLFTPAELRLTFAGSHDGPFLHAGSRQIRALA
jgi:hypothetical protein